MKLTIRQIEKLDKVFNKLNDHHEELGLDLSFALATWLGVNDNLIWRAYERWQIDLEISPIEAPYI